MLISLSCPLFLSQDIMKQLIQGAMELQSQSIFHQDIKIENILMDTDNSPVPRARYIDFGLSCFDRGTSTYSDFTGKMSASDLHLSITVILSNKAPHSPSVYLQEPGLSSNPNV